MRRVSWVLLAAVLCFTLVLSGCGGKKDAEGVIKDLAKVADQLEGEKGAYQGKGVMTINTGSTPQQYEVEVWYQAPSYYRISLTNGQKDLTQIVLRNDEGVFVLTPSLNKSFRFKSDWPENQGQVYLYQTMLGSILSDSTRQFAEIEDAYVFEVAANYHSHALVRQKIWLAKDNYSPKQIQVSDSEAKVVVDVRFSDFTFDTNLTKDSFDTNRNLSAMNEENKDVMAEVGEDGKPVAQGDPAGEQPGTAAEPAAAQHLGAFGIIEPSYTPAGVVSKGIQEMANSEDHAVILRYDGIYQYTIMESRPLDRAVSLAPGQVIDLGFTVALLTGDEQQTLTWTTEGVEYRITSGNLPASEMVQIAASMHGQSGK
ncbi:outer membrane lipoprotein carrier protein LolA [Paenibacillus sp. F411]|uniref:Putative lipoprotein n=1 Tax=Paenibacillus algicola TaxID=2565926 RepID=A0A4P8XNK6_9BACL|nr:MULTISPECIES: outer membrane lipoprotein carrier protein LolA [Paenibacillus]MBO2943738.1 outer membrane lipoprotein carrier protein LolA [Paenibacillus sp. F411]QCT04013.1 putative lipoprotein [Paenibacillus algicola]